jgi:SAM-dependent methyltransferase
MRERWAEAFTARAAAYWTPERVRARLGDKQLLLRPVEAAPLLRALGILKRDASMSPDTLRKYMQINHMVLLLKPLVLDLSRDHGTVRLLDAGCGSSYLTLLLAWCFKHIWRRPAQIVGVDRNAEVIGRCRERAELAGVEELLRFEAATIDALDTSALQPLHALLTLHACDTATDEALALGVRQGVELLAAAPCCQVELSRKLAALEPTTPPAALEPLWKIQHLRREAAATMTDMLRTLLLRGCGYRVTPMEFVPSEHTPKNTLLRAVRCGSADREAFDEYLALRRAIGGVGIRLEEILPAPHRAALRLS